MKRYFFALMVAMTCCSTVSAQHSDVEFGYDDASNPSALIFEVFEETSEGFAVFESEFEANDPFNSDDLSSDEPGFATNEDENLLVNQGDLLWINVLDAAANSSVGVGYVNFYNPATDMLEATGRVAFQGNSSSVEDGILDGSILESGSALQFLGQGDSDQEIHDHVVFDLLNESTTPNGAFGVLLELQSDFDADGTAELTSDQFWVIFNHGLSEEQFENDALRAFGVSAIPEPATAALLLLGVAAIGTRRRRS